MLLVDLIKEYSANGFVVQTRGNGSTDDIWVDADDCDKYNDVDMHELKVSLRSDQGVVHNYASDWIADGQVEIRVLF